MSIFEQPVLSFCAIICVDNVYCLLVFRKTWSQWKEEDNYMSHISHGSEGLHGPYKVLTFSKMDSFFKIPPLYGHMWSAVLVQETYPSQLQIGHFSLPWPIFTAPGYDGNHKCAPYFLETTLKFLPFLQKSNWLWSYQDSRVDFTPSE